MAKDEKRAQTNKNNYLWYKEHGICVKCGHNETIGGRVLCPDCQYKQNERMRERRKTKTKEQAEKRKKYVRDLYKRRKEQGLCVRCGRKALEGKTMCLEHLIIYRGYTIKHNEKKNAYKKYAENGLCRYCGKPLVDGKNLCEEHLKLFQDKIAHAREFVDKENHPWKKISKKEAESKKKLA